MDKLGIRYDGERKVISREENCNLIDDKGIGHFILRYLSQNQDKVAQICSVTGKMETFAELKLRCIRLAISLKELKITPGDVIVICCYNSMDNAVAYLASKLLGVVVASTDPTISVEDHKHLLSMVRPKLVFVSNETEELIRKTLVALNLDVFLVNFDGNFKTMQAPKLEESNFEAHQPKSTNDTALMLFSSGTTGLPKAICLSHNYLAFIVSLLNEFWDGRGNILAYTSTYWITATFLIYSTLVKGVARIISPRFDPKKVWEICEKFQVGLCMLAPAQTARALKYIPKKPTGYPKHLMVGGSTIYPEYFKELVAALPKTIVFQTYGCTELGLVTSGHLDGVKVNSLTSVGFPASGLSFKIVDEETEKVLGFNEPGEIRIKSPHAMNGYYEKDSSDRWDKEGFLRTGDIGYYDENFQFYITDRSKDMFKYISWHVVPSKLESILLQHADVREAAVIGIPHPEDDNHAMGIVVKKKGSRVTGDELEKFVENRVDERNRLRAGVRFVESMPYTPSGKLKRSTLRDQVLSGII